MPFVNRLHALLDHGPGRRRRVAVLFAGAIAMLASCAAVGASSGLAAAAGHTPAAGKWTVALANSYYGNSWREEMICSIKEEALTPQYTPYVSKVLVTNSGESVAAQVAAIRDFISEGVNAILIDPASTVGYNQVIQEALSRGIKVVVTDQDINDSAALLRQIESYQYEMGVMGMQWLAGQMHGHGNLVVVQGEIGAPANTARENGLLSVLKKYPNIHIVANVAGDWDDATAHTALASALAAHPNVGGVWLSGGSPGAILAMGSHPTIPFVGEDDGTPYLKWMVKYAKTEHAAVFTNPPAIGAAGLNEAVGLLRGLSYAKSIQLTPYLYSNQTASGLAYLKAHENIPLPASAPTGWSIPGVTHYTLSAMHSCLG